MKTQHILLLVLAFSVSTSWAQDPAGPSLALRGAIDRAIANNPSLLQTDTRVKETETEVPLARSAILPNLTSVFGEDRKRDPSVLRAKQFSAPYEEYSANLHLTQPLFQVGVLSAIHAAEKDVRISKLNADIGQRDLINNVIQAYYGVVVASRNVQTLLEQEKIAKESVDVSTRRERTGRGQLLDKLQSQTQLELLEGQLSTAKNNYKVAEAQLANLLGQKETGLAFTVPDILEAPDISAVDKNFMQHHDEIPEVQIAALSIQRISDQRDVLNGQNLPTLGIVGNYGYSNYHVSDLFRDEANSWDIGVQLTIPIFSGFSWHAQDQALLAQQDELRFAKTATENTISYQQTTSRKNLETARDSIRSGMEGLRLATASSAEARRNFRLATIDFLHYLSVQQAQVQAEQALDGYRYNYIVALGNYYAASGQNMNRLVDLLESYKPPQR